MRFKHSIYDPGIVQSNHCMSVNSSNQDVGQQRSFNRFDQLASLIIDIQHQDISLIHSIDQSKHILANNRSSLRFRSDRLNINVAWLYIDLESIAKWNDREEFLVQITRIWLAMNQLCTSLVIQVLTLLADNFRTGVIWNCPFLACFDAE